MIINHIVEFNVGLNEQVQESSYVSVTLRGVATVTPLHLT